MSTVLDTYGSNSITASVPNLIANFQAASVTTPVQVSNDGVVLVNWMSRLPLVLAVLKNSIEDRSSVTLSGVLNPATDNKNLGTVTFGPLTEHGACLPLYCPIIVQGGMPVPEFQIKVTVQTVTEAGVATVVPDAQVKNWIEIIVVEGNMGRMLYNLNAEKARMRRLAREIHGMKRLDLARFDALDRIGAELGVARAEEEIVYDAGTSQVVSRPYMDGTTKVMEPDSEYATRLRIYRPFLMPTRKFLEARLNGVVNYDAGLMPGIGYNRPVHIQETQNSFAISIQLVDVQGANRVTNFLNYVRDVVLIFPASIPATNTRHANRLLASENMAEVTALRASIRQNFTISNDLGLAPMLAGAISRAGRVTRALGVNVQWTITKGFDPASGSRYQLGLGLDMTPPTAAQINSLRTAIADANRVVTNDDVAEALIRDLKALTIPSNADDPIAAWFWNIAGLQTVHKTAGGNLYLSHLPTFGLTIAGPAAVANGATITFDGNYHAPGDPGSNALLVEVLNSAREEWVSAGNAAWTVLAEPAATAFLPTAVQLANGHAAYASCMSAGAQMLEHINTSIPQLQAVPASLYDVLKLPAPLSAGIMAGNAQAVRQFSQLVLIFQRLGLASLMTLVNGANEIHLVASVASLPEVGVNLGERRSSGLRWYVVPVGGVAKGNATIAPFGSKPTMTGTSAGLVAVVCLGYVRRDFCDPYEYRVVPTQNNLLTLHQYEYLMNFLEQTFPMGIEVNTFELRKFFVDLNGDGVAEPLSTAISKTYRKYFNPRMRGNYTNEEITNG